MHKGASVVEVDVATLKIGGTAVNKTLVDNIKHSFSDTLAQTQTTVTTTRLQVHFQDISVHLS